MQAQQVISCQAGVWSEDASHTQALDITAAGVRCPFQVGRQADGHKHSERGRDKQTYRKADRQTDRQRQADRQTNRRTDRQADTQTAGVMLTLVLRALP